MILKEGGLTYTNISIESIVSAVVLFTGAHSGFSMPLMGTDSFFFPRVSHVKPKGFIGYAPPKAGSALFELL